MLTFRKANLGDIDLLFNWANDPLARINSYQKNEITYIDHVEWFNKQILDVNNHFYIFLDEDGVAVGQVRINAGNQENAVISLQVDVDFRGKGYAKEMIEMASNDFLETNKGVQLLAYIFKTNEASYKSFKKAGFELLKEEIVKDIPSYILYKN
ncbi:MAG: GNAT family N-acetyltransferase [Pedobacter sp.]|uniref:GNAT family N-acetyltransferase n=1 Tax=Pedobacter sp. TaxID=1411316 RepID=UPI003566333E